MVVAGILELWLRVDDWISEEKLNIRFSLLHGKSNINSMIQ